MSVYAVVFVGSMGGLLALGALGATRAPLLWTASLSLTPSLGVAAARAFARRAVRAYPCLGAILGGWAEGRVDGDLVDHTTEEVLYASEARLLPLTDEGDG